MIVLNFDHLLEQQYALGRVAVESLVISKNCDDARKHGYATCMKVTPSLNCIRYKLKIQQLATIPNFKHS